MTLKRELENIIPWQASRYAVDVTEWRKFMTHDFDAPDRPMVYTAINKLISAEGMQLIEVGFGQCYDFVRFFKHLHDSGWIDYHGYDITEGFARFAQLEYPEYDFKLGGFTDLPTEGCDIIFTRHTFRHIGRKAYSICLARFLRATRDWALISWGEAPKGKRGVYRFDEKHQIQWNIHGQAVTDNVIEQEGFTYTVQELKGARKLYILRRDLQ